MFDHFECEIIHCYNEWKSANAFRGVSQQCIYCRNYVLASLGNWNPKTLRYSGGGNGNISKTRELKKKETVLFYSCIEIPA